MLLSNKFARCYLALCRSRQETREPVRRRGFDLHHIIPRALGGSDQPNNLVSLSPREHFIAHCLLYRAVADPQSRKAMAHVIHLMAKRGVASPARVYAEVRRAGRQGKTENHKAKISASHKGMPKPWLLNPAVIAKRAATVTGRKNPEHSARMKGRRHSAGHTSPRRGKKCPEISERMKGIPKPRIACPHCGVEGSSSNMHRWHFDNCPSAGGTRPTFAGRAQSKLLTCPHCGTSGRGNMTRYHFDNCRHA